MKKRILLSEVEHKAIKNLIALMRQIEQDGDIKEQTDTLEEALSKGVWNDKKEFSVSFTPEQLEALDGSTVLAEDYYEGGLDDFSETPINEEEIDLDHMNDLIYNSSGRFVEED